MDDVERVIREAEGARADGVPFPTKAPDGWVHLSVAAARLVAAFMPKAGTWVDAYKPVLGLASTEPVADTPDGRWAEHLAVQFAKMITRAAYEEHLVTGHRPLEGGAPVKLMNPEWWHTEDLFLRFRSWSIDPENVLSQRIDLPNWIWVEERSLETQVSRVVPLDAAEPIPCFEILDSSEFAPIPLHSAIELLAEVLPANEERVPVLGAPAGAVWLKELCASGAVKSLAGHMFRAINADRRGRGGKDVEALPNWRVPPEIWEALEMSPLQNWISGELLSKVDERNAYRLRRVMIDRNSLLTTLEGLGKVGRVQYRWQGQDSHFAEGFAPMWAIDQFGAAANEQAEETQADADFTAPPPVAAVASQQPAAAKVAKVAKTDGFKRSRSRQVKDKEWQKLLRQAIRRILEADAREAAKGQGGASIPGDKELARMIAPHADGIPPSTFNYQVLRITQEEQERASNRLQY